MYVSSDISNHTCTSLLTCSHLTSTHYHIFFKSYLYVSELFTPHIHTLQLYIFLFIHTCTSLLTCAHLTSIHCQKQIVQCPPIEFANYHYIETKDEPHVIWCVCLFIKYVSFDICSIHVRFVLYNVCASHVQIAHM